MASEGGSSKSNERNGNQARAGRMAYLISGKFSPQGYGPTKNRSGKAMTGATDERVSLSGARSMASANVAAIAGDKSVRVNVTPYDPSKPGNKGRTIIDGRGWQTPVSQG